MGTHLNVSEDALWFDAFNSKWIVPYVTGSLTDDQGARMKEEFLACVRRHLERMPDPDARWGWKIPPSIYLLPFFHGLYPHMKFIHVVRDGRDMAFSDNKNQLRNFGAHVLDHDAQSLLPPVQAGALWNTVNLRAAEYGEGELKQRYLAVIFEELCRDPRPVIERMYRFLGAPEHRSIDRLLSTIEWPSSIGRWRQQDPAVLADVQRVAEPGLKYFGYLEAAERWRQPPRQEPRRWFDFRRFFQE
ncbi:MAG: sulfotransferase [Nitrospirota bacterium]